MTPDSLTLTLTLIEGMHLARLVDDFIDLIQVETTDSDPAMARLAPNPYPGDPAASQEFRGASEQTLLDRRIVDARVVARALAPSLPDPEESDHEMWDDDAALAAITVTVGVEEIDAWLRTLTAIRLVLATRLDIADENDQDPEDPRFGVYDWLGYRLELFIEAVEEQGL